MKRCTRQIKWRWAVLAFAAIFAGAAAWTRADGTFPCFEGWQRARRCMKCLNKAVVCPPSINSTCKLDTSRWYQKDGQWVNGYRKDVTYALGTCAKVGGISCALYSCDVCRTAFGNPGKYVCHTEKFYWTQGCSPTEYIEELDTAMNTPGGTWVCR